MSLATAWPYSIDAASSELLCFDILPLLSLKLSLRSCREGTFFPTSSLQPTHRALSDFNSRSGLMPRVSYGACRLLKRNEIANGGGALAQYVTKAQDKCIMDPQPRY
jgi:hypothetical protein